MVIRPATASDAFRLVDIIVERHPETRYAGHVDIDEDVARKMFAQAAFRHGHTNEGGTWLQVAVNGDDIEAFMFGILGRVYHVGTKLCASDVFLIGRKTASPRSLAKLLDGYIGWAAGNPKVHEIGLSWADTIPGNEGIMDLYRRKGFVLGAQSFRRVSQAEAIAA